MIMVQFVTWLVPCKTAAVLAHVLCTPYNLAPVYLKTHTKGSFVFSCNLPAALFAELSGFVCATAVTQGWNKYWNKSQHRKLTMEKKILPLLLLGLKSLTLWLQVQHFTTKLSLLPILMCCIFAFRPKHICFSLFLFFYVHMWVLFFY